jgi:hypothetical protein
LLQDPERAASVIDRGLNVSTTEKTPTGVLVGAFIALEGVLEEEG